MNPTNYGIITGTKYAKAPGDGGTSRRRDTGGIAPMRNNRTPNSTTESIPYGYCHCGCGRKTQIAKKTQRSEGVLKGQPRKYASPGCAGKHSGAKRAASRKVFPHPGFESTTCIPLACGTAALIDDADAPMVEGRSWHKTRGYVARADQGRREFLHRLIMNAPDDLEVDHINGNRIDNRRSNLRLASRAQNMQNKPVNKTRNLPKGVSRNWNKFRARISIHGKEYDLGTFDTPEAAAQAYDRAAIKMHGEFANTNGTQP